MIGTVTIGTTMATFAIRGVNAIQPLKTILEMARKLLRNTSKH